MDAPVKEHTEAPPRGEAFAERLRQAVIVEAARRELLQAQAKRSLGASRPVPQVPPVGTAPARPAAHSGRKAAAMMASAIVVLAGFGALLGAVTGSGGGGPSPARLRQGSALLPDAPKRVIPASNAALMGLAKLQGEAAPGFRLVDQSGAPVSLSELDANHAVVLSFIDDRGTGVGPVIAEELVAAARDLGASSLRVDFVAVNLNAAYSGPRWLEEFVAGHGLGRLRFTYLTGSPAVLRATWARYGIEVQAGAPGGAVSHSEAMYFISPGGVMRYEATPYADVASNGVGSLPVAAISQWGRGIAEYAKAVLGRPARD